MLLCPVPSPYRYSSFVHIPQFLRLEASIRRRDGHYRWVIGVVVSNNAVHGSSKVP